jgi:hypothetical protein
LTSRLSSGFFVGMTVPAAALVAAYLVEAMTTWTPVRYHAPKTEADVRAYYMTIAMQVVTVARDESALFKDDDDRVRTSTQIVALGAYEGNFISWVDDGSCNDSVWRNKHTDLLRAGDCDGGHAWSTWQIHVNQGITLTADGLFTYDAKGWQGLDLAKDRLKPIRVAIHIVRASFKSTGSLRGYTGEGKDTPKAIARTKRARDWLVEHPFDAWVKAHPSP